MHNQSMSPAREIVGAWLFCALVALLSLGLSAVAPVT